VYIIVAANHVPVTPNNIATRSQLLAPRPLMILSGHPPTLHTVMLRGIALSAFLQPVITAGSQVAPCCQVIIV